MSQFDPLDQSHADGPYDVLGNSSGINTSYFAGPALLDALYWALF